MQNIIVDTGPIVALFEPKDQWHDAIKKCLNVSRARFITTWPVVTEVMHHLGGYIEAQVAFLEWIERDGLRVDSAIGQDVARVKHLILKYSDVPMDFADASIVLLAEQSGIRQILTIDSDFAVYKIKGKNYFKYVSY